MTDIHPSALIDKKAELASDVIIGPFTIIEADVKIDKGTRIDSNVVVKNGARIGKECHIHHGCIVASLPQDLKFSGENTYFEIGDNTEIREYCTLNRGTSHSGKTVIGKNSFLMAYCHTAHDCRVGDNVILANGVQLAGHVTIEDWVIIGGLTPVHQFCKVGAHAFIGGGYRVVQDVPPYILCAGEPLTYKGLNSVGLKRRGFNNEIIKVLNHTYRYIYRSKLNTTQALKEIESNIENIPEVRRVVDFIKNGERGIIR